jgi:glycosyltransferase involved in cell wall biosynthesis
VLIEAMAAGKPVISTLASNIPEVVSHGKNGLLVHPGVTGELEKAFSTLLRNPGLARQMGEKGRRTVAERFTLGRMVDETERLFLEQADLI